MLSYSVDLGAGIERGCRLVQDDDRRITEEQPGQRHPLPLPTGEVAAAEVCRAEDRVVAVAKAGESLVDAGFPGRHLDRCAVIEPSVVAHRDVVVGGEQVPHEVLEDDRHPLPDLFRIELGDVFSVPGHLPARRRVQTGEELGEGGLA